MRLQQRLRRPKTMANPGLSYVEVMIATFVLVLVAIANLEVFTSFSKSFIESRQRDIARSTILNDISLTRRLVQGYCRHNDGSLDPCNNGLSSAQDKDGSYNPANSDCNSNRLAVAMVRDNPIEFPSTKIVNPEAQEQEFMTDTVITRTLTAEGNELRVSYNTNPESKVQVQMSTSMIPPALGWCP